MDDIDRFVEELLNDRRIREGAAFTSRSYGDQPIIQTGKQYRESLENHPPQRTRPRPGDPNKIRSPHQGTQTVPPRPAEQARPAQTSFRPEEWDGYRQDQPSFRAEETDRPHQGQTAFRPEETGRLHQGQTAFRPVEPNRPGRPTFHSPEPLSADPPRPLGTSHDRSPVPERYYRLRELAQRQGNVGTTSYQGMLAYGSRSASRLFYEQALLMEDFEDDFDFEGTFFQYYPTYSSMSLTQLRGYFSWRTHVRHGDVRPAPTSFAFLYVYELLCGIGTTPGIQGYRDLRAFRDAYRKVMDAPGSGFVNYTLLWLRDYVVYHGLDASLAQRAQGEILLAVSTLLRGEKAALAAQGLTRHLAAIHPVEGSAPSDEELFAALDTCSSYRLSGSRLRREHLDDLRSVSCAVFRALCVHCRRRRKTDYVEGLFGTPTDEVHTMFSSAVFYDPEPHPDTVFAVGPSESFTCRDGKWRHHFSCRNPTSSRELGNLLRTVDGRLRVAIEYPYPLKERPVQAYVAKIIDTAIADHLEARRQEEARRITIDLSRLAGIRAAAAVTQEALLTEEERGDEGRSRQVGVADHLGQAEAGGSSEQVRAGRRLGQVGVAERPGQVGAGGSSEQVGAGRRLGPVGVAERPGQVGAEDHSGQVGAGSHPGKASTGGRSWITEAEGPSEHAEVESAQAVLGTSASVTSGTTGQSATTVVTAAAPSDAPGYPTQADTSLNLTELEIRVLTGLLVDDPPTLGAIDPPLSLLVDAINEKLFDLVGDAVIEFVSDEPAIIEDYRTDVKEALGL